MSNKYSLSRTRHALMNEVISCFVTEKVTLYATFKEIQCAQEADTPKQEIDNTKIEIKHPTNSSDTSMTRQNRLHAKQINFNEIWEYSTLSILPKQYDIGLKTRLQPCADPERERE